MEPILFDEFQNFTLKKKATDISQGVKVLQQYINDLHIFSYKANDKSWRCHRKNDCLLEWDMELENGIFFAGTKNTLASVITAASNVPLT